MFSNSFRPYLKSLNKLYNWNYVKCKYFMQNSRLTSSISNAKSIKDKPNKIVNLSNSTVTTSHRNYEINWADEMKKLHAEEPKSVLEPIDNENKDMIKTIHPNIQPSFNFAAYVSKSEMLQQLIHLGVDLHRIEKKSGIPEYLLKLDFEKDIKGHLQFFDNIGIDASAYGLMITKNPLIFRENLNDLQTRINYLESKAFKFDDIRRICEKNPFWLMFSTQRIDKRLGHFQKTFDLTGSQVRCLAVKRPKIITYNLETIRMNTFSIREEMGFNEDEVKKLLMTVPKIWTMNQAELLRRFDYIHKIMEIPQNQLIQQPEIFYCRVFRLQQRHEFLKSVNRAQYDPTKDMYVSFKSLVEGTDHEFVSNVAKCSHKEYDNFLRQQ